MNRLFVAYKPSGIGSNLFLLKLKKKYKPKKAGFSGTLDPFAKGVLLIGFGSHTKLFRFLDKTPKKYRATLWLGAKSDSLDSELSIKPDFGKNGGLQIATPCFRIGSFAPASHIYAAPNTL